MDGKILTGSLGGLPIRGGLVNVGSGDVSHAFGAVAGLAKGLFKVGGGLALGAACLALLLGGISLSGEENEKKERKNKAEDFKRRLREMLSIDILSLVKTEGQMFYGICAAENLDFSCEGEAISVPTQMIKLITRTEIDRLHFNVVTLFDNSSYVIDEPHGKNGSTPTLNFWTVSGQRKIKIAENLHFVQGAMPDDKTELTQNLNAFLSQQKENIVSLIGVEGLRKIIDECGIDPIRLLLADPGANEKKPEQACGGTKLDGAIPDDLQADLQNLQADLQNLQADLRASNERVKSRTQALNVYISGDFQAAIERHINASKALNAHASGIIN
ncbi:MAG: hypothetical protein PHE24_05815, partial [Patescibacteria group bacterium]|nr:hypothetical protein [Patescibacteria group bacterium]